MIEALKHSSLIDKVGGKFKLSALIQKRMLELMQGSRPLIEDIQGKSLMEIAVLELVQDKIAIDYEASGVTRPAGSQPASKKPAF
jgi:DNA-directed RNA polymerase subunit omega